MFLCGEKQIKRKEELMLKMCISRTRNILFLYQNWIFGKPKKYINIKK